MSANRDLVGPLVEESLRHDARVQATTRRCTHRVELDGVEMQAGDWVEVGIGSANRDETVYDDPGVFRLDRDDPRDHLGVWRRPPHLPRSHPGPHRGIVRGQRAVRPEWRKCQ